MAGASSSGRDPDSREATMSAVRKTIAVASSVLIGILACSSPTEPTGRVLAWIGSAHDRRVDAPDVVTAGAVFEATVYAYGSGSRICNDPAGTTVTYAGSVARVQGFVRVPTDPATTCTRDLVRYPQQVRLLFATPGLRTIRLVGRGPSGRDDAALDSTDRTVVVIP